MWLYAIHLVWVFDYCLEGTCTDTYITSGNCEYVLPKCHTAFLTHYSDVICISVTAYRATTDSTVPTRQSFRLTTRKTLAPALLALHEGNPQIEYYAHGFPLPGSNNAVSVFISSLQYLYIQWYICVHKWHWHGKLKYILHDNMAIASPNV